MQSSRVKSAGIGFCIMVLTILLIAAVTIPIHAVIDLRASLGIEPREPDAIGHGASPAYGFILMYRVFAAMVFYGVVALGVGGWVAVRLWQARSVGVFRTGLTAVIATLLVQLGAMHVAPLSPNDAMQWLSPAAALGHALLGALVGRWVLGSSGLLGPRG